MEFLKIGFLLALSCIAQIQAGLIPPASQQLYKLQNHVSLDQRASYQLETNLKINSVWNQDEDQLLEVYLSECRVSAEGVKRSITSLPDRPFYISVVKGQPHQVIAHTGRDQSLLNLERGIASLLQIRHAGDEELDVSGHCRVSYQVKSSTRVEKTKRDCALWDLRVSYHPEDALGIAQESKEQISYDLSADGLLLRAESKESHRLRLKLKPDVGSWVKSTLILEHLGTGSSEEITQLSYSTLEAAVESLLEWYRVFDLEADVDGQISELKEQTLVEQFELSLEQLQTEDVGKSSLALAYAKLLPLARITQQDQFEELLKKYPKLASQLVDLLGAVQTFDAHNATFSHLYHEADTTSEQLELLEKYLQSLAVGTHPERNILEHLYKLLEIKGQKKFKDSILQTLATLTRQSNLDNNDPLLQQIRSYLLDGLKSEDPLLYIRALQNLQDSSTIDQLLEQALNQEDSKLSVAALQALKSFSVKRFTPEHRQVFEGIFYQRSGRFDSSARTLSLDIILDMRPSSEQLGQLIDFLASNDRQFEIKTYVWQKLQMLAEICPRFRALLKAELTQRSKVNNYHVLGQKGLTTVLTRPLSQSPGFNESLLSTQEVYNGILKRGSVEFLLEAGRSKVSSFKLGIYTAGLASMVGDGDDSTGGNDPIPADDDLVGEETVTAGMEISVQGSQLRPLVFFVGQTELMGHVWGGSASESTPAYQATTLNQDHEQYVILSSGATLHLRLLGAKSVDLNGKVGFSLWNRNAQTEIQQNTGSAVVGHLAVGFTYAQLQQDFTLTHEPKLSLQADLDFYSGIKLCMQLQRSEQLLTYQNVRSVYLHKVERSYAKHWRSSLIHKSPGCTFALNQKNNEMCNLIHANS
ncbi:microsomal triacylglycerol transfer protein [Drosophila willistoni]|nr:microsomal triacylglycerol transfer protein [Drosophila willistoni]